MHEGKPLDRRGKIILCCFIVFLVIMLVGVWVIWLFV